MLPPASRSKNQLGVPGSQSSVSCADRLNSCRYWRTLQQRVIPVSSSIAQIVLVFLMLRPAILAGNGQSTTQNQSSPKIDPQQLFERGEAALKAGDLDAAEHDFRGVLAINPQVAGAYANLGVIYMRRKQWPQALDMLRKAEHLAPQIAGIRLNV